MPSTYVFGGTQNTPEAVERRRLHILKGVAEIAWKRDHGGLGYTQPFAINEIWLGRVERGEDGRPELVLTDRGSMFATFCLRIPTPAFARALASLAEPYDDAVRAAWIGLDAADKAHRGPVFKRKGWMDPPPPDAPLPEILRMKP